MSDTSLTQCMIDDWIEANDDSNSKEAINDICGGSLLRVLDGCLQSYRRNRACGDAFFTNPITKEAAT